MNQHPSNLAAGAALHSLLESYQWLPDLADAQARTPRLPATPSTGQRLARTRLALAERADRPALTGAKLSGATAAPLRFAAVDAERFAVTAVTDAAWIAHSELRGRHGHAFAGPWTVATGTRWKITCGYLDASIEYLNPTTADQVHRRLDEADRVIRALAGVGPNRRPVHAACPVCQRLGTLQAEVSNPDRERWTFTCTGKTCRCTGIDCPCHRPGREPGQRHTWPASALPNLDTLLGPKAAA